jgi:hypothetical protein
MHTIVIDQGHFVVAHEPVLRSARDRGVVSPGVLAKEGVHLHDLGFHVSNDPAQSCRLLRHQATYIRLDAAARGRHFGDVALFDSRAVGASALVASIRTLRWRVEG